ncbi:MAG TPA: hypothetical protein VL201_03540, partial [Patescibacteria group bacterium]|nr:hypothetical protein [Patescibacteria group bacterium]
MKIIFYSSIILLLSHNLYGMKRDYSTNTNQKKNNIEIYEDLEDGVNPDSENFTLYNDKRLLKKTDEVIVKDSFTAISPTLKVNHKTELKMAEQQVKKLYELDKEKESFSFTYESQKILHQKEYLTFSKVYYDRLFGAENLINDLYHRFPPQLIAVILQNGNKFDEDLDRNKI